MLTRACPIRATGEDCARCGGRGSLVDRKGKTLRVFCTGAGKEGARELLNPVPLWLGDRQAEIGTDFAELYFTFEDAGQVSEVLRRYLDRLPFEEEFTRGFTIGLWSDLRSLQTMVRLLFNVGLRCGSAGHRQSFWGCGLVPDPFSKRQKRRRTQ